MPRNSLRIRGAPAMACPYGCVLELLCGVSDLVTVGSTLCHVPHREARLVAPWSRESEPTEGVISVAISLSVVLLLAIILVVLIRGGNIKAGPAIVAVLFGFFLASTGMAPSINRFMNSIADTINSISF